MSTNNVEVHQPNIELPPQPFGPEEDLEKLPGQPSAPERTGNQPAVAAPPPPVDPTLLAPLPHAQTPTTIVVTTPLTTTDTGLSAQDSDLIEKEWVEKAKDIVAQTQDDPYHQKKEISKVKAEYIHKRFNKTVKTDDTAV